MATIADYPDGVGTAGPTIDRLITHPPEYQTQIFRNEDGSVRVNVQPCGVQRWEIEYEGMSDSDLSAIRTHLNLAKGKVNDFSFYSRNEAATFDKVNYESVEIGRAPKTWSRNLRITLVRFG